MTKYRHSLRTKSLAVLLALLCMAALFPTTAFAASDTIKLEDFGYSGVSYESDALGTCHMNQMYSNVGGKTTVGFCGTKGGGMGTSLIGQSWNNPREITDPTVKLVMAYYYACSTHTHTDQAIALGLDISWDPYVTWYMDAWTQAVIWRYKEGSLGADPVVACAEEFVHVLNSLDSRSFTSIDDLYDGTSFRDRVQYIIDMGRQGVWGDCKVYEYSFAGAGSTEHPAASVQSAVIGELTRETVGETYTLIVKKVDSGNPNKGLAGAQFHIQADNGSFMRDVYTGSDGTYALENLPAGTYAVTEMSAPEGYEIDNAGPQYAVLPSNGNNTVTVTFTDTPVISGSGSIRKVDADNPTKGLAGAVIKIEGVDNDFVGI